MANHFKPGLDILGQKFEGLVSSWGDQMGDNSMKAKFCREL